MKKENFLTGRREFIRKTAIATIGATGFSMISPSLFAMDNEDHLFADDDNINLIRPVEGYSPHIGIMVSMMDWIRASVLRSVNGLTTEQLDYLMDPQANTIGALLLHLAATDVIYQDMTFYGVSRGFSEANKAKWQVPMSLGEEGRKQIKGNKLEYYLDILKEVREKTLSEFKKRDDKWFAEIDPSFFGKKPTNNFCKWFHVCEHEANHRGQITVIKKRLTGKGGD